MYTGLEINPCKVNSLDLTTVLESADQIKQINTRMYPCNFIAVVAHA